MSLRVVVAAVFVALLATAPASPAGKPKLPPPPKTAAGRPATVVARGVRTPTEFAFGFGRIFVAGYGDEANNKVAGGVYVLQAGKAVRLPGSPLHAFGVAFTGSTLYVSGGNGALNEIYAWSGWNGKRFTESRVVVALPDPFTGFSGIALGSDGLIYAGIYLGTAIKADYSAGMTPYANDVVSVDPATGEITVVSTGIRQPWQLVFAAGHSGPLVSDLGQDNLGKKRPADWIVEAQPGANFGFPSCPATLATCGQYSKPFAAFPPHASPMGLAALGGKLYAALFGGTGKGAEVVSLPITGGRFSPVLGGFPAPVLALGSHAGKVYAGDLTGAIYSFTP